MKLSTYLYFIFVFLSLFLSTLQAEKISRVVAKLDDAGNVSYAVRSINGEVAEDELQFTSSYIRQKGIADEALAEIQKQQNDEYIKSLILAKKGNLVINTIDDFTKLSL